MLTTKDLVSWLTTAQRMREESWNHSRSRYGKTLYYCLQQSKPQKATKTDFAIADTLLYQCWNEIQDWNHMFNKDEK